MISYDRYQAILAQSDAATRQAAERAFKALLGKIRDGAKPRAAVDAVLKEFNADAIAGFREALNAILESSLGPKEVKAYKVGKVKLAEALYANSQAVAGVSEQIIEKHLQGLHDARGLSKALYEGYNFQDDPLHVVKRLPKYLQVEFDKFKAAKLKTPALRAAYLQAIRQKEAGAGMDQLEKVLRVAFYERNRYYANRIARTELHRNYTDRLAKELMEEDQIQYVQIRLSSKHPKPDICDRHAKLDAYGLGPGVYPKADAPKPPFHPHCYCLTAPRIDIFDAQPRFNPKAERKFLAALPANEARQVAGSRAKLERALKGDATLEDLYNEGKDPLYQWQRVGDVGQDGRMKVTSEKTATEFADGCLNAPRNKQPPLFIGAMDPAAVAQAVALGIRIRGPQVALDHDYTRHALLHHGSPAERMRGQEPITDADLALAVTILNQTKNLKPGTPPTSKNGATRLEVTEEVGQYRYTVVYEVRRASVVVYTMFKRPK